MIKFLLSSRVTLPEGECGRGDLDPPNRGAIAIGALGLSTPAWAAGVGEPADAAVQVCRVDGDERYGNSVRNQVAGPIDIDVEVGQSRSGEIPSSRVTLRTSFEPMD